MTPYDEGQVSEFIGDASDAYAEAGQPWDPSASVWVARMQFDAVSMGYPAAREKQLAELKSALGTTPTPVPPDPDLPVSLPELIVRGHCFQTADGVPWTAIQCSDFNLLNRWQHGENILPVLAQRRACGFNLLRVWIAYDIPGIGTFLDVDFKRIPAFVAFCARYGLYVEFCAYAGINDPDHWPLLCDAADWSDPHPLLELVNELDQNTNEPDHMGRVFRLDDYDRPSGLLASHGSNGSEKRPVEPFWDYATFHTNGAPEEQRKVGHNGMEIWSGPTLTNETSRWPDVGMWVGADTNRMADLAFDSSAGAALLCAGSCFHSFNGKTSTLWDSVAESVARAWVAGAMGVDLDYQDGAYRRLDPGVFLRIYQRFYNDARGSWTVEIRK